MPVDAGDVWVSNGLFTLTLDFGAGVFDGSERWLEIAVRPGTSAGGYTALTALWRRTYEKRSKILKREGKGKAPSPLRSAGTPKSGGDLDAPP